MRLFIDAAVFRAGTSRAAALLGVVLVSATLAGCANDKDVMAPDEPAEKIYNEGLTLLNKGDLDGAAKRFEDIDKTHPYSEWARKALLMDTYVYYEAGKYDDAISAGKRYLALHPGSQDAPYVSYLVASSLYDSIPDISRDQRRTRQALDALDDVIRKYPNTEYAAGAKRKVEVARDQLAGKEMLIGRYYLEQRNYTGAINRFKVVITQYQTTRQTEEALFRITEAYMALGIVNEAQTAAAVLGYNYPDSQWYKDAFKLVQSKGLLPQENKASWISQAFKKLGVG
ncbi:putative lipoprotein precursor [Azorhizobium caulinodans ORS 571]|uniref:Outer membrane protein assembly factor BamD n=1 Tax=Azorhizobium caulinodans (strain ATCC 43989 / DSM 5975 / JCM 20966 / LMG 6465 / NBRC 14845 / NCIMB 13405 / ORS 571) TaxID=438753 RepID=A8HZC6_AZOC5|nr:MULTISPECIES: outer membrane protein assembly factor BamD [Azorhizobium]TDT91277.1 Beta-barrel assembly machine subunit BamD [Azorhizobium sp. AG788]BAF90565.1 putative lipoprotein precursor [Azorhizobium caulinodans ORS 571]